MTAVLFTRLVGLFGVDAMLAEAKETVEEDLATDPYLRWILLLALVTTGFYFWYRVPNFAAPDEYSRILRPMKAAGNAMGGGGIDGFREALLDGRALGSFFYLTSTVLAVVFVLVVLSGSLGDFTQLGSITSRWELWHATPAWFWTSSVLLVRLVSVVLGIGTVYLVYRTGTEMYDRRAGRFAAVLLSVSLGFVAMTHEAGEDVPLVFLTSLLIYIAYRYATSGNRKLFLAGCALGGLAVAFKFSGGIGLVLLASAYLYRGATHRDRLWQPRTLLYGAGVATLALYVGFPNAVVGGPVVFGRRLFNEYARHIGTGTTGTSVAPPFFGYGVLYPYLAGLGLPLFAVVSGSLAVGLGRLVRSRTDAVPELLLFPALGAFVGVFLLAGEAQTHHLLPTYPMLLLVAGGTLSELYEPDDRRRRFGVAILLVLSSIYGGVGVTGYANAPRDSAVSWMAEEQPEDAETAVFENSIADVAAVHGRRLDHYEFDEANATGPLVANETDYTRWMVGTARRDVEYVQLTCHREVAYLLPENERRYPERTAYVERLLANESEYRTVATFGSSPTAYLDRHTGPPMHRLLAAGVRPDPTNLESCVVILEETDT